MCAESKVLGTFFPELFPPHPTTPAPQGMAGYLREGEGFISPAAAAKSFQVLTNRAEVSTPEGRENIYSRTTPELLPSSLKCASEREPPGQTVGLLSSGSGA